MDPFRRLPSVDGLSRCEALSAYPERFRVAAAREAIDHMRRALRIGADLDESSLEAAAVAAAAKLARPSLRPAVNLSGVILHTGLGRARLADAAVQQILEVGSSHCFLELDEESGKRGDRQDHVCSALCELTGAESAHVVNNAAAAVVLTLVAIARGGEVLLSRGQMVEIGGSFRMPDIVKESGCRLVEVGCTNKTRTSDYEVAITSESAAILRCHTSNFKISGFVSQPGAKDLAKVAHAHGLPFIDDMGTGCIVDTSRFGLPRAPTIQDSVAAGADVVTASGDKLLGGPQAGLILGRATLIDKVRRHPLARAMRIDKLTLAGLEATLRLYSQSRELEIPTIAALARPLEEIDRLASALAACASGATVEAGRTEVGGGSAPDTTLPTRRVRLPFPQADAVSAKLRASGIVARIEDGSVWLDPRTLSQEELAPVCEVLKSL